MSEKKKKGFWRSIGRRGHSARHSFIETSSQCSFGNSSDDLSATDRLPVGPVSGSLDRLTALSSKPPKQSFFTLKSKTPTFWKPLFQHSTFVSSAPIVHTGTAHVQHQFVQTDSPTKPTTSDFGVQAVMSECSTYTLDALVQTCFAWDGSLKQADDPAVAEIDRNEVGCSQRFLHDDSTAANKESFLEYETVTGKPKELTSSKVCCEYSTSETGKPLATFDYLTDEKFALCDSILSSINQESSGISENRKMSDSILMNINRELGDAEWKMFCATFPEIQSNFKSQVENEMPVKLCEDGFGLEYPVKHETDLRESCGKSPNPFLDVKFKFDKIRDDFQTPPAGLCDVENEQARKIKNLVIDPQFDVFREEPASTLEASAPVDNFSSHTYESNDTTNLCESTCVPANDPDEKTVMALEPCYAEVMSSPVQHSMNFQHEPVTKATDTSRKPDDTENLSSLQSKNPFICGVDALLYQNAIHFESCENLEQLEDEIIRSLYSPLPACDDSSEQELAAKEEVCCQFEPKAKETSISSVSGGHDDVDEQKSEINYEAPKRRNEIPSESNVAKNWKLLNPPLENITEESTTDDDSCSYPSVHHKTSDQIKLNSNACAASPDSKSMVSQSAENFNLKDEFSVSGRLPEYTSVNEISEIVVQLPPRKAKICVNVFELARASRSSSYSTAPTKDKSLQNENLQGDAKTEMFGKDAIEVTELSEKCDSTTNRNKICSPIDMCDEHSDSPKEKHISKSFIVLKESQKEQEISVSSSSDALVDLKSEQHTSPPPPPPPPPPVTTHNISDFNLSKGPSPIGSSKKRIADSSTSAKTPMIVELEKKFLTRQKIADDLESIAKKIVMNAQLECGANKEDNSWKRTNPEFQDHNEVHNGFEDVHLQEPGTHNDMASLHSSITKDISEQNFAGHTVITDQPPLPGAVLIDEKVTVNGDKIHRDKYYTIPVKEVLKEKSSTTKFIPAPPKHEGIGPTEDGVPLSLRQSVKKENMSDWYKTMYKTLHKLDNEGDTYVIGYTSDPESKKKGKESPKKLSIRNGLQNHGSSTKEDIILHGYPPSAKSSISTFTSQPRPVSEYVPGYSSSVVDNQKNYVSKRHFPTDQQISPSYEIKDGYESDTYILKKNLTVEPDVEKQKIWYRQIQHGGDIPQFGLGKAAPERSPDPVVGPPPPLSVKLASKIHQPNLHQKVSRPSTLPPDTSDIGNCIGQSNGFYANQMRQVIHNELQEKGFHISLTNDKYAKRTPLEKSVCAHVLYNFTAESPREISLKKDDTVVIHRELDKNWYEGELNGSVGIFPISYVAILPPEHVSPQSNKELNGLGKILYDFTAHTSVELQARKGEEICLIRKVDDNWYEGRIDGKKGIIPSSYIFVIEEPVSCSTQKQSISPSAKNVSSGLLEISASSVSTTPLSSPSVRSQFTNSPQNGYKVCGKKGSQLIEPVLYRTLYRYSPQNNDELELIEGDTVYVVEICDDGWYVGTSVRTGELGIIPGNYMEKV